MTKTPKYINSPSWREGGKEIAGWLGLYIIIFLLFLAAMLLTGGNR